MRHIEIKICGLTNPDDALWALDAGADYIGFVLYSRSPRGIKPAGLLRLLDRVQVSRRAVGVFVNDSPELVAAVARDADLAAVQIHGDENAEAFKSMCVPVWRAVRVGENDIAPDPGSWKAERYVVDAAVPGEYGGTGQCADWDRARELAGKYRVMLAGGLTPENAAEAVLKVRPAGLDVSSGVEAAPGRKDTDKVKAFIRAARDASARLADKGRGEAEKES